jgi:hypothetical protein
MTSRYGRQVGAVCFVLCLARVAAAQDAAPVSTETDERGFGVRGPNVIVLDHLAGVLRSTIEEEGEDEQSAVQVGLLHHPLILGVKPALTRLGYHRFFGPVSLGAGFHYSNGLYAGGETLAVAPRLGISIPTGSGGIWIRGGVTYHENSLVVQKTKLWLGGGEVTYAAPMLPNFGLLVSALAEISLSGEQTLEVSFGGLRPKTSKDVKVRTFGLSLGFYFDF